MPKQNEDSTRARLFRAGVKIFAQKGYGDATVREICKEAETANINSINYYFGSKELLYREILEFIFSEYDKRNLQGWDQKTPEEQLKAMIVAYCRMLYEDNAFTSNAAAIFVHEMARPSSFVEDMVDQYNRPEVERHMQMFRRLLGEGADDDAVRDCLVSVSGQLLYYSFAWPLFSRLFPDYDADQRHEAWAEHVFAFSMGGIAAIRKRLKAKNED
ncbi:transcriptional regulator, TetR family [Desulfatibacillum aliphaticivorans]|uniref:Transcriptional regulator, TetR family n=1 Tax=Desulfatibacillum aliphaticivorans TaxID=218208 RepID=B8FNC8_DESAL|nr:TetR/AcrR family transcriptional regulator [Desulfatibacillum aliphaticivorans]ACL06097.1 transcriptional regulator, TetR family [Desulfatibacillum aliphaticivorans]